MQHQHAGHTLRTMRWNLYANLYTTAVLQYSFATSCIRTARWEHTLLAVLNLLPVRPLFQRQAPVFASQARGAGWRCIGAVWTPLCPTRFSAHRCHGGSRLVGKRAGRTPPPSCCVEASSSLQSRREWPACGFGVTQNRMARCPRRRIRRRHRALPRAPRIPRPPRTARRRSEGTARLRAAVVEAGRHRRPRHHPLCCLQHSRQTAPRSHA